MTRKRQPPASLVRSSAAEYLTFVAASGGGGVEAVYADENVWLSQKMMAQLYDVDVRTINYHLKKVFEDSELQEDAVIQNYRITASDGKTYDTKHYNLSAIIAVGYKVNSERAVQFRKWATRVVEEFTIKGFAMDDERLKRGGSVLGDRYFEEQLQRVREIRISERKFYQKITDIYATSVDYDVAQATKRFFATVQNKLHWAIHRQTARCSRTPARSRPRLPRHMPRASSRSTASCRTDCSRATSTALWPRPSASRRRPARLSLARRRSARSHDSLHRIGGRGRRVRGPKTQRGDGGCATNRRDESARHREANVTISTRESLHLDRKSIRKVTGSTADFGELARDCVCFANSAGGTLLIGIEDDDDAPPVTQRIDPLLLDRVSELSVNVQVVPELKRHDNGGEYISLTIPRSAGVASTSGRYFLRIGDTCQPIVGDDVMRLANERPATPW